MTSPNVAFNMKFSLGLALHSAVCCLFAMVFTMMLSKDQPLLPERCIRFALEKSTAAGARAISMHTKQWLQM